MKETTHKSAFTMIEVLIIVSIIGTLTAIGLVSYNGHLLHSRTNQNKINAEEVSQKVTTWANTYKIYPNQIKQSNKGLEYDYNNVSTDQQQLFIDTISEDAREQVLKGEINNPSETNPEGILVEFCHRPDDENTSIGARITYWNLVDKKVEHVYAGNGDETDTLCLKVVETIRYNE